MRRSLIAIGVSAVVILIWPMTALAAVLVPLGTAGNYAVIAATGITNAGNGSWVTGQMANSGLCASITGFPPPGTGGSSTSGHIDCANPAATQAQTDNIAAYTNAAGQTPCTNVGANLGGQTLVAGIYCDPGPGTLAITGGQTLTLDGQGSSSGVWIFQSASTLITGSAAVVSLINGAQPCDIFWKVTSSATIGSATVFVGNIMALASIGMFTRATLNGRAMAQTGSVTLQENRIIQPSGCGYGVPAFVAGPLGTTLPATLGVPFELRGAFNWLLVIAVGAGFGATVLVVSSRRRRRRTV